MADPQLRWGSEVVDRLRFGASAGGSAVVLDLGCGSGRVTEVLLERHPQVRVVAVDKSSSMLQHAQRRLASFADRVELRRFDLEGDIAALSVEFGRFDAVLSTGTLHWVRDHEAMYRALPTLLAPGGALAAQYGGEGSLAEVRAILDELGIDWRQHNCYASPAATAQWLDAAGFTDIWTWLGTEVVLFDTAADAAGYLLHGALAPYLSVFPEAEQEDVAATVAARLDTPTLTFTRLNVLARVG